MSVLAFRVKEAERKMQVAALALDFERAIICRDEMRAAQAELDALRVDPEERKVISLKTRQVFTPPSESEPASSVEPPVCEPTFKPDEEDISLLKHTLHEVEQGNLSGLMIFAAHVEPDGELSVVSSWSTTPAWDHMQQFLGAMEEAKHDLLSISADLAEEISDED